jgi:PEP-CTERM motif
MRFGQAHHTLLVAVISGFAFLSTGIAQCGVIQLRLDVAQQETATGVDYSLFASVSPFGQASKQVIAPDGTEFQLTDSAVPGSGVSGLTFSDLSNRFFGDWTIREAPLSGGTPFEYQFTFSPFPLDDVFHQTAHMDAPLDGATVDKDFTVKWAFSGGATPAARLIRHSAELAATVEFAPGPQPQATMHVDLRGMASGQMTIVAGTNQSLAAYLSDATPVGAPGPNLYYPGGTFLNLTAPAQVTVVPEPSTLRLVIVAAAAVVAGWLWTRRSASAGVRHGVVRG